MERFYRETGRGAIQHWWEFVEWCKRQKETQHDPD